MWAVKLQQMQDGRLYIAGIGAGIENTPDGMQSQVLLAADRIAMINPANGNTKPMFVGQGDQIFMNDVFLKRLTAPTITSGGNPPASDRRLKENIEIIDNATDAIRKINGYTYTLKENGAHCAGVIAQEVEEAIPEAVGSFIHYGEELQGPTVDGNELREETRYLNVDYAAVTGLLVQVARETDDRVTALEEENTTLRQNLATAGTRISTLENQVSELVALVRQLTGSEH